MLRSVLRSVPLVGPTPPVPPTLLPSTARGARVRRTAPRPATRLAAVALAAAASIAAAPSPARAQGAPVNSIDTILDDMRLRNDARLAGVPGTFGWAVGPGHVVMGADPRGTATPWWWNPSNRRMKSTDWWTSLVGWMAVFEGEGNGAWNTRVEMRSLRTYVKSARTGRWSEVAGGPIEGALYPKSMSGPRTGRVDLRYGPDDVRAVRPDPNAVFHGWILQNGTATIEPWDVAAVHVSIEARLAVDDASRPDDRARAVYLMHVGADYYPDRSNDMSAFAPTGYNPGVGVSRAKRLRDTWQAFNFTTVNVGTVEPTGRAMSEAELRADPPPIR